MQKTLTLPKITVQTAQKRLKHLTSRAQEWFILFHSHVAKKLYIRQTGRCVYDSLKRHNSINQANFGHIGINYRNCRCPADLKELHCYQQERLTTDARNY